MTENFNFSEAMKELEAINTWFQNEDIDLEEGLEKLRRGQELIKNCQQRLKKVENEFVEIRDTMQAEAAEATEDNNGDLPF